MFENALKSITARSISLSMTVLKREFLQLSRDEKFAVMCFFRNHPDRDIIRIFFSELSSEDCFLRGAAASGLAMIGGGPVLNRLLRMLQNTKAGQELRITIISSLSHIRNIEPSKDLIRTLIAILSSSREDSLCRSTAAEGLYYALDECDRRRMEYKSGVSALLGALDDSSPDVRCSSVFALGQLGVQQALPKLRELEKSDHAKCKGRGLVSEIASEAISFILT